MNQRLWLPVWIAAVSALAACSTQTRYPGSWAPIEPGGESCRPLDGTFDNLGEWRAGEDMDQSALASVFFPLGTGEMGGAYLEREAVTRVAFNADGEGTVHTTAWIGDEPLFERTLTSRDLSCQDGFLSFRDSGWVLEGLIGVIAGVWSRYRVAIARDGALILELREVHAGLVFTVVPLAGKARTWLRFAPFVPRGAASPEAPGGVRRTAMPPYQLLLPENAEKYSGYAQAVDCIGQARAQAPSPLSDTEAVRLSGRSTQAFLTGGRDGKLAPSGRSHRTMGWVPATHDFRVEKLHWASPVVADRYVLCLLDRGFRWQDR